MGECNTTSSVLTQGKTAIINLTEKENPEVLDICVIFDNPSAAQEGIGKAGIRLFTVMYAIMVCLLCFSVRIFNIFQTSVSADSRKTCKNCWFLDVFSRRLEKEFHLPGMV